MAHLPQMYSLYELYFAAALGQLKSSTAGRDTAHLRQFYIDREFDHFPLHRARVWRRPDGKLRSRTIGWRALVSRTRLERPYA